MNMPLRSTDTAVVAIPAPAAAATVLAIPTKQTTFGTRLRTRANHVAVRVLPPLIVVGAMLVLWEFLCSQPGASLPPPSRVLDETWELIVDPFYDRGGIDKGLFWHMSASLQRVALGYSLAAIVGVALGTLVGQSTWAMRGLDPIFQVLRTVPPLAWLPLALAAFRSGQPSAIFVIFITAIWPIIINTAVGIRNIPQDYRNVAQVLRLNQFEFFFKIMVPAAAPYIFTGLRIGIGFFIWDAWNSSRISEIILALIYVGLVGFVLDRIVAAAATVVTRGTAAN
jgi:nitrate/nitrite transport system permease protein